MVGCSAEQIAQGSAPVNSIVNFNTSNELVIMQFLRNVFADVDEMPRGIHRQQTNLTTGSCQGLAHLQDCNRFPVLWRMWKFLANLQYLHRECLEMVLLAHTNLHFHCYIAERYLCFNYPIQYFSIEICRNCAVHIRYGESIESSLAERFPASPTGSLQIIDVGYLRQKNESVL